MKYYFADRQACWVDFYHVVEADSEEEAWEAYHVGDTEYIDSEVGDCIDFLEGECEMIPALPHGIAKDNP